MRQAPRCAAGAPHRHLHYKLVLRADSLQHYQDVPIKHPPTPTPNPRTPPLLTHTSDITPAWCGPGRMIRRCLVNVHQQCNTVHKKSQGFTHRSHCSAQSQTPPTIEAKAKRPNMYLPMHRQPSKLRIAGTLQTTPRHCAGYFDVNQARKYPDCRLANNLASTYEA